MVTQILNLLTNFIIHTISILGYFGVAVLMAVQSAAIPLPSEVTMPFAGFLVAAGRFNLLLVALVGGLGSAFGASVAYWIARQGGRPLIERYGRLILISKHDLEITDKFFLKFGLLAVFFGRFIPVINSFIALPAGLARTHFGKFLFYTFAGASLWSLLLAYIGMRLGPEWLTLRERFHNLDVIIAILIIIAAGLWIWRHLRHRA